MKDVQEILRQKENDLVRVRQEVEALRCVAPLLMERDDRSGPHSEALWPEPKPTNRWPLKLEDAPRTPPA